MNKKSIEHGTYGGYNQHNKLNIPMCDDCRRAGTNYLYEWRQIKLRHVEQLLTGQTQ